jgi:glycosyltransferase involved in cell wall biosynthesis
MVSNINCIRDIDSNFILFNSSIVPRKNLHFLIQAFKSSNLSSKGFKLCVAGKIHDDKYGERIKEICSNNSTIKLLGYVDEIEKTWLFLNAHAFVSPSCVEGFGIPVLDAYILGLNVLASNIPSHKEIASIPAVDRNLNLLALNNVDSWISALRKIDSDEKITTFLKRKRISNFEISFHNLSKAFDKKLVELMTE